MAEFMVNTDMFGMYVRIPTGYSREMHIYKVVSKFNTNSYCDVPIVYGSKPVPHEKESHSLSDLEDVLNVIHCGIDETEVIRVALKDCEVVTPTADVAPKSEVERWRRNLEAVLEERAETKAEVARAVIEEFADLVTQYVKDRDLYLVAFKNVIAYAKDVLTKKYTAQEQGSDSRQTVENEKKYAERKDGEGNDV